MTMTTKQNKTKKIERRIFHFAKSGLLNYHRIYQLFPYNNSSHTRPLHVHNCEYGNLSSIHSSIHSTKTKREKELQRSAHICQNITIEKNRLKYTHVTHCITPQTVSVCSLFILYSCSFYICFSVHVYVQLSSVHFVSLSLFVSHWTVE